MPKLLDRKPPWRLWCGPTTDAVDLMEKKGGKKAARPRGGTISASWSAGKTNAAAQGIVKPAWADASVGQTWTGKPMATFSG